MGASGSSKNPQQKSSSKFKPKPKLVQSIEQFLLAFGYPLQSMSLLHSTPTSPSGSRRISAASAMSSSSMSTSASASAFGTEDAEGKPVPFLLPTGVFGAIPSGGRLSIGEILLLGGLDSTGNARAGVEGVDEMGVTSMRMEEGRVWIGSPDDVVWGDDELSISYTGSSSREVAFSTPSSPHAPYHLQPPPQVQPHPTRQESTHIPTPLTAPVHFHPQPPSKLRTASSSVLPLPSVHQLAPPPPARIASSSGTNGKLIKPNSTLKSKHASLTLPASTPAEVLRQTPKQLPTPPESASSLEDGDDEVATVETAETMSSDLRALTSGRVASTTDHHHYRHQEAKSKAHYVKAATSLGHGTNLRTPSEGVKKGGFMARFGFGKLMGVKSSASDVGRN